MEYVYTFNYPPAQKDLWILEGKYLFCQTLKSKVLLTKNNIPCDTSIFIKAKIDVYHKDSDFDVLLEKIKQTKYQYSSYKVIYLKNEQNHEDYQETLTWCNQVSKCIEGKNLMREQDHTLAVTKLGDEWIFGYYYHGVPSWQKYFKKPYTFSNALDLRLARTVVNIAGRNDMHISLVDPCCGMGSVVLEALSLGYEMKGYDISKEISFKARKNLIYFGYDPDIVQRSAIEQIDVKYDCAIIDIPYNLYTPITHEEQCSILRSARKIADKLILISYDYMDKELLDVGFEIESYCVVKKTEFVSFERKIYVCV